MTQRRSHRRLLQVLVLVCVGTLLTIALPAHSTFDGDNGRILFRRYTNESHTRGAVFTVRPDGTHERQLTSDKAGVTTEPDASPDGRWIVYSLYPNAHEDQSRLKKIRADGTHQSTLDQTCIDPCLTDGYPAWAPDGKRIAFQRGLGPRQGHITMFALFTVRADGTHARQVTQRNRDPLARQPYGDFAPAWSPNGRRLAFERFSQTTGHLAIFTVRLDGTGLRRLTPWWLDASQPDYSPNGRWILFRTRHNSDVHGNIQLVRPDGTGRHLVTHAPPGRGKWLSASFSPNGRRITAGYTTVEDGQQLNAEVFSFRLDGSRLRNVTTSPDLWESAVDWAAAIQD
jgi:Tol biopolymer transport system component